MSTDSVLVAVVGAGAVPDVDRLIDALHALPARRRHASGRTDPSCPHRAPAPAACARPTSAPPRSSPPTEAIGRVSADTVAAYPPGIPNLLPGEVVTAEVVDFLQQTAAAPFGHVRGAIVKDMSLFRVVSRLMRQAPSLRFVSHRRLRHARRSGSSTDSRRRHPRALVPHRGPEAVPHLVLGPLVVPGVDATSIGVAEQLGVHPPRDDRLGRHQARPHLIGGAEPPTDAVRATRSVGIHVDRLVLGVVARPLLTRRDVGQPQHPVLIAPVDVAGPAPRRREQQPGRLGLGGQDEPSTVEEFGKVVVDGIKEECEKHGLVVPRMAVEPGRSIVANAGVTLYTVGTVKEIPNIRTYVAVDGGMNDNIRTALYGAHYEALIANKADQPREMVGTVAGKHCESGDIVVRDAPLQCPEAGDILCVCATGAYCQSMSSNYNKNVRPGVVFVRDGEWRWVVRRETYDDLMKCEVE